MNLEEEMLKNRLYVEHGKAVYKAIYYGGKYEIVKR